MQVKAHNASSVIPHWSSIQDLRVAADIAGARFYQDHRFPGDVAGIEPFEIYGQAVGVPANGGFSHYGIFTDDNGNTIIIATESTERWSALKAKGIAGSNPIVFTIPRLFGDGHGEIDALTIAGIDAEIEGRASWKDQDELMQANRSAIERVGGFPQKFNNFPTLLELIEKRGKKFDEPIVILSSGSPVTFESIIKPFAKLIIGAAGSVLAVVGIPPNIIQTLTGLVEAAFNGDPISIKTLVSVAQIITPAPLRKYVDDATKLVGNIQSGNYLEAAKTLGVDVGAEVKGLLSSIEQGDLVQTVLRSAKEFTPIMGSITNALHGDVMHKFLSNVTTKTISNAIQDAGTVVGIPHMTHLFAALTSPTSVGAITGADDVVQAILHYTNDVKSPDVLRGLANIMNGFATGVDTFDEVLLRSLKSKANALASEGKQLVMPISIPLEKRLTMAQNIAGDVGVQVIIDEATKVYARFKEFA